MKRKHSRSHSLNNSRSHKSRSTSNLGGESDAKEAQFMPSYEDVPSNQDRDSKLAQMIAKDKSGSLRLRLQMAQELVTVVERGVKNMHNLQSPISENEAT